MFRIESYITSIILSYVEKYVKNLRRQDAQVSLWDGEGLFQNLELDLDVLEKELNLPFIVLSGHINQLLIRVPWTKLGSEPVKITIDTIECVLKLKTSQQKKEKKNDKNYRASTEFDELPPPSYVQSLINKIIGNLSVTFNNVILKYIEDDIVLSMNIKSITLDSCNENWIPDIIELTPSQLVLRKILNLSDVTICLDRRNASGCIETYLEPLLYKCSLSIRLCRMFRSPHSARPYTTQMDMFCSKIAFILTEPQLPMLLRLLTMILELNPTDVPEANNIVDDECYNRSPSSCSSISESNTTNNDGWVDWMWSWVPSVNLTSEVNELPLNSETAVSGHTLSTGIYIDTLLFILKIKSSKKLNDYRPLLQITFHGSSIKMVSHPSDWINVQFGISKASMDSLGDCTCGAQDCYTSTYFSSGGIQDLYLSKSLFQDNVNINTYSDNIFSFDHHLNKFSETILLEKTPAFAIDYLFTQISNLYQNNCDDVSENNFPIPEEKCLLRFVAGPSILNITSGLIHRFEFLYKLLLGHDLILLTAPLQSSHLEEKYNALINSHVQVMVYQFTIFNPMIKVFPACHVPIPSSQRHKKNQKSCLKQFDSVFENPPIAIFELKVLDGRIVTPKKKSTWYFIPKHLIPNMAEEKKLLLKTRTVFRVKDLVVNLVLSNSIHKLLKINNIGFNATIDCFPNYNSDYILDIDLISLSTSKENYLLMYYIIHSIIMSNHRRLLRINNYIFKSSLLEDAPGTIELKFNLEGVKIYQKLENKLSCIKVILNNMNAKMVTYSILNDSVSSAVLFSTPEFIKNSVPFLHVILQSPSEIEASEMPLIYFKIGQLDMNFDPMLFDWLVYLPEINKQKEIKKKISTTSDAVFFSVPSRKISETSISSDPKKKHKPSVHSSVSENVSFHSANYMYLKNESKEMKIVRLFNKWKSSMIFVDTSRVALYFPSKSLSMLKKSPSYNNLDLNELLEMSTNNGNGLLVLKISSISLKCVVPKNQMEQYLNSTPVRFPNGLWSPDGVYFPWQLNFCKLECYTIHSSYDIAYQRTYTHKIQLLYPFSAQCTLAITTQYHNNNTQSLKSLAACIHCDSDPISISISEQQVRLVADLLKKKIEVYKVIFSNIEYGTFFNRSVAHEMSSIPEDEPVETKIHTFDVRKTEENIKLSGWFQWTLARFSLIIKNNPEHSSLENVKLVLDLEDVISSLDFGLSYHKLKLKISSASIQHFIKSVKEEQWKHGPYLGLILKGYDPLNSSEKSSKTDGFLNFTLTRAFKSSFQGPKSNKDNTHLHMVSDEMLKLNQQLMDEYIMEIVIKVQPVDIVISPLNLHKFLSILDPLLEIFINSKCMINPSNNHNMLEPNKELIGKTLPLFYLDIALLRIFIPISAQDSKIENEDTTIIQVNSIIINQNPENPITRTPLRKDLYVEAEKRGLLSIPGSIVEDRQYQIVINEFSIKTGFWVDLKQVLECYQASSTLDADHQPNAALLWNEGKRPRAMGNSNLDEINTSPLFNKVSFHSVFAPAIIFEPENILVCSSWMEVNTLNEINVTLSVEQLCLLNMLASQSNEFILSHLKTNYNHVVQDEKMQPKLIAESLTHDSGIHSTEDNVKFFEESSSMSLVENKINTQSNIAPFSKKDINTPNKIPIDVIITGNQINFNFFQRIVKNEMKTSEPLIFVVVHQPHVFFSLSSTSDSCQVIFFDLNISLAPKNKICNIEIPDSKMYSVSLFETKSNTMDEIPLAFFTLKISRPISICQYKVELNLGRAISLLLDKLKMDHCSNLLNIVKKILQKNPLPNPKTKDNAHLHSKLDKPEILNQTFKIDPVVSQYINDEFGLHKYDNSASESAIETSIISKTTNTNVSEIPVLVNDNYWYSKPVVMNLTTQQIFFQLSSENNDNIVFSIESILSKLNCLWKKPSERMNGEVTLNSVTVSIGHNHLNSNSNDLLLHPWTMTLEIALSSDPWVPESYRPTKQLKISTDYISFNVSPDHYVIIRQLWNEYKYLFEYNKSSTKTFCQNSEADEQFYQDDLRAGAFQFLENNSSDLPLPYQIYFSEHLSNNPPKITWRYPQPRTLTKVVVQPVPMDVDVDIELHLQWYDEIQNCFRELTSFLFPKYEPMLLRLESWQAISNTWRIIMNNSFTTHCPLQIKSLVGCLRVDSFFSPSLVPRLQLSLSASSIKVNITYNIKKKTYLARYDCISDVPPKHKLVIFNLDQVNIGFKLQEGEMNTSAKAHVKIELLNYGTLTQIPILKSFCLFTSYHITKPVPDIQYNIQTGAIACQFGPSMINSLTAAIELWKNNSYFITTPYIICNDTNFQIIFGQTNTNETITLNSLQSYQYTWRVPTDHPRMRFSVGNIENVSWSNEISLQPEVLMSFTVENHKGEPHILIVSITNMSPSIIKVIVSSQLSILNKTNYLLDARFTKIKQVDEQKDDGHQNLVLQTLTVATESISPSIMLYNELKVTLKLRFNIPHEEGPWSGPIPLHAVDFVNGNQNSWLVKIPKKDNMKKYRSIWCRLFIENINKIPRMLIVLMPMYVVRSYLPYDTLLNFDLVDHKLERNTVIQAKSAIDLNDIQHVDLPGTMKDVYNLTIKLNEESSASSPPVSITYYMNIDTPELINDSYFTIEEMLRGKYTIMDSDLQWPFIGKQYSNIKWKQSDTPDTQTTVKVQHYGHLDHNNGLSRVIVVQPWALIVNTSGQVITLCNSTDILCNLDNFCVVAPPVIENTFYIDMNIGSISHRSQPLQLSNNQSFYMPQVNGLIPLKGHTSVVINCENHIGFLNVCSLDHNNMRIIHIQSLYVASNHSSIDLKVLGVCAVPSSGGLDIPENVDDHSIDLPKNLNELGKPLALWTLIGKENIANEELVQYFILVSNGNISCPIKLTELKNEEHPLPILFSSCDFNPLICVTLQELDNQYFFTVYNQPYPQFILYNNCPMSLTLALAKKSKSKSKSKEAIPFSLDWNWMYKINSGKNAYLSFPHSVSCNQIPRVLIGLDKKPFKGWFASISLSVCESRLVPVPGQINDIKVLITKRAFTLDVIFKPAAQFEFSANEVRLRLAKSDQYKDTSSTNNEILNNVRQECIRPPSNTSQNNVSTSIYKLWPSIKCHIHTFILTLFVDDIGFNSKAVISLTLDNIAATLDANQDASKEEMNLVISINNIQIDNNAFVDGHYDFPVVLVKQKKNCEEIYCDTSFLKPLSNVINDLRQLDSAIILKFTLDKTYYLTPVILDLEITLFTFEAFIEDRYCYYLLEVLKNFKSTMSFTKEHNITRDEFIPLHYLVLAHSQEFRNPLVFRTFTIKSFKVMISLHTSTTFYVALDRSPLDFTEFSKSNLTTSSYQLGRSLSLHYFLNAIYGSGWALGSLEFWGSPGGLARSVGTGLYDFVTLSAQGMTEGPKEFFVGVLSGSASLVKHVTTGALSSVTKFASSWSRTFNRLTLEAEDLEQIEEIRRLRPQNLSQGIIQGLSEFGISLLGAVGGLVNHPIQYAIQEGPERRRGFVNTVAIGLVEAFTKPISGAAELVAMTGEGFLAGVGWIKSPQLRSSLGNSVVGFGTSELRYSWLILNKHLSPMEQVLLTCDGSMDNVEHDQKLSELTLVLTDRFLYLISDLNSLLPNILRLPISQIVTPIQRHSDPSLITLTIRMSAQNDTTYARVADYVRKSQSFLNMELKTVSGNPDQTHKLLVNPQIRNHVLNLIEFIKRHIQNKGYSVI